MLVDTLLAEVCITWAVTALVPPADDMLGVAVSTGNTLVQGLSWFRDAHLLERIQSQDEDGGHKDEGLQSG